MITAVLFGAFALFLVVGIPIGVALGLSCLVVISLSDGIGPSFLAQSLVTSVNSFPLLAVPFFIIAGELMGQGGMSRRLLDTANVFFGRAAGSLALVAIAACMFFAALTGSGPATVAAIGLIMYPEMIKRGYDRKYSIGLLASAGSLGVIIPPSLSMIFYAIMANVSVGDMFLAGFMPGILIGVMLMIYSYIYAKKHGYDGDKERISRQEKLKIVWEAKWALICPVIILGGIYGGLFTPTEAAGIAVIYALIIGLLVYRDMTLKDIWSVLAKSAQTVGILVIIFGTASTFGRILALEQIPAQIAGFVSGVTDSSIITILIINIVLLIVGCFIDTGAAIIIMTPILLPVATAVGLDPVHFGIIMVVNLAIGFITPPIGVNLFVATGLSGMKLDDVARGVIPFLIVCIIALLIITYIPAISLFLPSLMK